MTRPEIDCRRSMVKTSAGQAKLSPTLLRLGLKMDPNHRYTHRYLDAKERQLRRQDDVVRDVMKPHA